MENQKKVAEHQHPIIFFHGDKGGVGKSLSSCVFVDWLKKHEAPVALIDGDSRNPDVLRMFDGHIESVGFNLKNHSGWMDVIDFIITNPEKTIVISLPAGIGHDIEKEANNFTQTLTALSRPLVLFWVINRLQDSVNLLNEALASLGTNNIKQSIVIKNLFFGEPDKFTRWNNSQTRSEFEKNGGKTIELTELQERVVDKIFSMPAIKPFSNLVVKISESHRSPAGLTPSENLELTYWIQKNHKEFDSIRSLIGI